MSFSFLSALKLNLEKFRDRKAFFIKEEFYTYQDLHDMIRRIYALITSMTVTTGNCVGVFTRDNLETYAAVMAVWYSGNIFVPLNPSAPAIRNREIIRQAGIRLILHSDGLPEWSEDMSDI
jgi:D-alanine--poly(phosphoribitol) ligase subunit 1